MFPLEEPERRQSFPGDGYATGGAAWPAKSAPALSQWLGPRLLGPPAWHSPFSCPGTLTVSWWSPSFAKCWESSQGWGWQAGSLAEGIWERWASGDRAAVSWGGAGLEGDRRLEEVPAAE